MLVVQRLQLGLLGMIERTAGTNIKAISINLSSMKTSKFSVLEMIKEEDGELEKDEVMANEETERQAPVRAGLRDRSTYEQLGHDYFNNSESLVYLIFIINQQEVL